MSRLLVAMLFFSTTHVNFTVLLVGQRALGSIAISFLETRVQQPNVPLYGSEIPKPGLLMIALGLFFHRFFVPLLYPGTSAGISCGFTFIYLNETQSPDPVT